jgi:glycine cleavage system H protein
MEIEEQLLYTKDHEWVLVEENLATIGITDYAQESLGDITFIQLPPSGDEVEQFGQISSIESVKAASDIFAPISGKIKDVNAALEDDPGVINRSPYDKGWIAKIEMSDTEELSNLMTAEEYRMFLENAE